MLDPIFSHSIETHVCPEQAVAKSQTYATPFESLPRHNRLMLFICKVKNGWYLTDNKACFVIYKCPWCGSKLK